MVKLNGKYNYIDEKGEFLSEVWLDGAENFFDGYARIKTKDEEYLMNPNGEIYDNGKWKKLTSDEDLNESLISLKDFILESLKNN